MDIESLLRSLNDHEVEYVLIGAAAFPVHGYARATIDVDFFIRPTAENARRARLALSAFGYDLTDVSDEAGRRQASGAPYESRRDNVLDRGPALP